MRISDGVQTCALPISFSADMIRPKRIAMFSSLRKLFKSEPDPREARRPLWNAVVAAARAPHWYAAGGVHVTLDGRFYLISLALVLVLHLIDETGRATGQGRGGQVW